MTAAWDWPRRMYALALLLVAAIGLPAAWAQTPAPFNQHDVQQEVNVQDKSGIWVLHFTFKSPRLISVDVPGHGQKVVWYMWFQVYNSDSKPHTFFPDFELVTQDQSVAHVYHDQISPKVVEAIRKVEDPSNVQDIKDVVTISRQPLPPSKADAYPHKVSGLAIWYETGKDKSLQESNRYSIFVTGLSNGWSVDDKGVIRRKTLQLNFRRLSDIRYYQDAREIQFLPPHQWIYRASDINLSDLYKKPAALKKTTPANK
jgi:hypothetical protein